MVIDFPNKRQQASSGLLKSALATSCDRLELHLVLRGRLADSILVAAGYKQLHPTDYVLGALNALHHGVSA